MARGGRWSDGEVVEVRDMRDAETTLAIIRERGKITMSGSWQTSKAKVEGRSQPGNGL